LTVHGLYIDLYDQKWPLQYTLMVLFDCSRYGKRINKSCWNLF